MDVGVIGWAGWDFRCGNDLRQIPLVCPPLPLAGEGPGERAGGGNSDGLHFVDTPALSPTLSRKRELEGPRLLMTRRAFSPLPLAGEGPGERAGDGNIDGLHFVDTPALSPTLCRKRERMSASGHWKAQGC
ncbi:hypothetical protein CBM2629_B40130 [Cupriavidus taiwanensis]|nr:hypothetical protein CBM2629_B40130 [Cupriavidus taiwanensis]